MQKIIIEIVFIYKPFLQGITITMFVVFKFLSAGESPVLPVCRRKDWFVVRWFILVDYCRVWYLASDLTV